jgi:hypothetical protein
MLSVQFSRRRNVQEEEGAWEVTLKAVLEPARSVLYCEFGWAAIGDATYKRA